MVDAVQAIQSAIEMASRLRTLSKKLQDAEFQMLLVDGDVRPSRLCQDAERNTDLHGGLLHDQMECVRMGHKGEGPGA